MNKFKNDKEFMLALLAYNGTYLEHASDELKADKEVIMAALQSGYSLPYEHVSDALKTDKDFLLEIVSLDAYCLEFFSEELKQDEQIVLAAAKHFGDAALEFGADKFKTNKNIITEAVKSSSKVLSFLAENEKNDKNLVITAVKHHGGSPLQYASEQLRNDKDVVIAAITAVDQYHSTFQYASEELQNDKDVVITAVSHNGDALQYASEELQNDKDVAMAALINSTGAFKYVSERLRSDKEFILHAIGQKDVDAVDDDLDSYISDNIPEKLKADKDFVLEMVKVNGMVLGCVADELKVDKEVVTLAVKNNGKAYAHFEWEDETFYDKEIILAAASKGGTPSVIPIFTLDEEFFDKKQERIISGSIDSLLRGMGIGGAVISTIKNMTIAFYKEQEKDYNKDESAVIMELANLSPPIGIKFRQIRTGERAIQWNKDLIEELPYYNLKNPVWEAAFAFTQTATNIPMSRLYQTVTNVSEAFGEDLAAWQRIGLMAGWTKWNLGIENSKTASKRRSKNKRKKVTKTIYY